MVEVLRSTVINAPIEAVWGLIRDFNSHLFWHPAIADSVIDDHLPGDSVGAVRFFRLRSGEQLRERLLYMSDIGHAFSYTITESERIPLLNYVAHVELKPVTDGERTFWRWHSSFSTPAGQEQQLAELVASNVYEAGFEAVRQRLEQHPARVTAASFLSQTSVEKEPSSALGVVTGDAIIVDHYGGPEVMRFGKISVPLPGDDEIRIQQTAIGVNYIDVYCRSGFFKMLQLPDSPGMEAVGVVVDVGNRVDHLKVGDRVGYACPPVGAYASVRTLNADLVFRLPDFLGDEQAAACLLKGITAAFLLFDVHEVKAGDSVLVFAPAGGVGRLLSQWASHLGAHVIGATSSSSKVNTARQAGATEVIVPGEQSLAEQIMALTQGRGVDVIYDAVGKDTFTHSLQALAARGHLISYGQASGPIGEQNIDALAAKSITLSRPNYADYTNTPEKLQPLLDKLFAALEQGVISSEIGQRFPLAEAAVAHQALESRTTQASTILTVR